MSVAEMEPQSEAHGGEGRHDSPEKVDARERLGIWLFIGADIITVAALLFTYLYLRGVNTDNHWMILQGYKGNLHTYQEWENLLNNGANIGNPSNIYVGTLSAGLQWLVCLLTIASAAVLWFGEKGLRATKNAKAFSPMALFAMVLALAGVAVAAVQLSDIPQVFVAVNDSITMSYTTYDSAMMAIIASTLGHLAILAFLGLGLAIRSARGVVSGDRWYQVRLVRYFWVWVAISSIVVSLITTTINTVH
jgi:heme/copper-type cytochrome/quinol oxidase subunit 3